MHQQHRDVRAAAVRAGYACLLHPPRATAAPGAIVHRVRVRPDERSHRHANGRFRCDDAKTCEGMQELSMSSIVLRDNLVMIFYS